MTLLVVGSELHKSGGVHVYPNHGFRDLRAAAGHVGCHGFTDTADRRPGGDARAGARVGGNVRLVRELGIIARGGLGQSFGDGNGVRTSGFLGGRGGSGRPGRRCADVHVGL